MTPYRYYFEDFKPGEVQPLGEYTLSKDEILAFARQYDPQPFHVDEVAAEHSIYGGLIASGWNTCAIAMRMMCDAYLLQAASMGSPGVDEIRWLKPVRPGDTLRGERATLSVKPSQSKPDRGVVHSEWRIYNQQGELVMTMRGMGLFGRRPT